MGAIGSDWSWAYADHAAWHRSLIVYIDECGYTHSIQFKSSYICRWCLVLSIPRGFVYPLVSRFLMVAARLVDQPGPSTCTIKKRELSSLTLTICKLSYNNSDTLLSRADSFSTRRESVRSASWSASGSRWSCLPIRRIRINKRHRYRPEHWNHFKETHLCKNKIWPIHRQRGS